MKKNIKRAAALLALVLPLSACNKPIKSEKKVTFRTVNTSGIVAYTIPPGEYELSRTVKTVFPAETPEETTVSTRHFETTIPETLVGGTEAPTGAQTSAAEIQPAAPVQTTKAAPVKTAGTAPSQAQTTRPPAADSGGYARVGENGILVVKREDGHYWGLMPCWGTYGLCEKWAGNVNKFKQKLPDVNVYQTVIPTSIEFYVPEKYSDITGSQKGKIDHISGLLENVADIDSYSALGAHLDEAIFSRTDHHWLPLGGYYSAKEFAGAAGVPFADISEYKAVTAKNFVGSMYGYSKDAHLYNDPEDFTLYIPPNNRSLKTTYYNTSFTGGREGSLIVTPNASAYYCSFLGTDNIIAKIETDCKNGRTLVIFKESYGNAMVPFLTSSFETIYVCDLRYFTPNAVTFCKNVGATDLLFAVCTFTAAGPNGNYLSIILDQ